MLKWYQFSNIINENNRIKILLNQYIYYLDQQIYIYRSENMIKIFRNYKLLFQNSMNIMNNETY